MLSGTARRSLMLRLLMLLLLGVLAVALAMNAFPHLALLALGAVPLLVTLLATKHSLFSYRRFRSAFTSEVLAPVSYTHLTLPTKA